jgi:predicted ATP-dependent endonuclease of OLD family
LDWKFKHFGTNGDEIEIQIHDPAISNQYSRPSLRSSGFRTYFLLQMIISARVQKNHSNSYIYLFDEPGTYLHPRAQIDLLRSLENISGHAQILYTTHSIFLISKNHPNRNRVISKNLQGTQIDLKPFNRNWKAVRDSLGILLSNNFLIADKTLLVEGPSDCIYLLRAIKEAKSLGRIDLDLNDLCIVDSGSFDNFIAMAKIMLNEGRNVVGLLDGDQPLRKLEEINKVFEKELKNKTFVLLSLEENKSIEDMIPDIVHLQKSILNVADDLVKNKIRKLKEKINIQEESKKIAPDGRKTLGKIIEEVTASWFQPECKISKLSIALNYEDTASEDSCIDDVALKLIKKIQSALGISGEGSIDKEIFDSL